VRCRFEDVAQTGAGEGLPRFDIGKIGRFGSFIPVESQDFVDIAFAMKNPDHPQSFLCVKVVNSNDLKPIDWPSAEAF
jgi:hypothetical protein